MQIGVNIRPFCSEFLENVGKYYEIFIFTASHKIYAEEVVDLIDPNFEYIEGILNRNHCLVTNHGKYIKDLRIIKNRSLKDMVLIDDSVCSFALNLNNGIPIIRWENNKNDIELKYLSDYLIEISDAVDLRIPIQARFNLEILSTMSFEELLDTS